MRPMQGWQYLKAFMDWLNSRKAVSEFGCLNHDKGYIYIEGHE
jgi:hypothetical protein